MRILCLFFLAAFGLSSCGRRDGVKAAENEVHSGKYMRAIAAYEDALGGGDKPAIHLRMAEIFSTKLHDPAGAAYHYRRIIALDPNGRLAEVARERLKRQVSGNASVQLSGIPGRSPKTSTPSQMVVRAEQEARAKVKTYQVQPGETLVSISRKVYGNPNRWKDILDANMNQLHNPDELKPGQKIILP